MKKLNSYSVFEELHSFTCTFIQQIFIEALLSLNTDLAVEQCTYKQMIGAQYNVCD